MRKVERLTDPAKDIASGHAAGVAIVDRAAQAANFAACSCSSRRFLVAFFSFLWALQLLALQGRQAGANNRGSRFRNARSYIFVATNRSSSGVD